MTDRGRRSESAALLFSLQPLSITNSAPAGSSFAVPRMGGGASLSASSYVPPSPQLVISRPRSSRRGSMGGRAGAGPGGSNGAAAS